MAEAAVRCVRCRAQTVLDAQRRCALCGASQPGGKSKLTAEEVSALFDVHQRGRPIREIAKAIWKRRGYASAPSARSSLEQHFEQEEIRRGLRPPKPKKRRKKGARRLLTDDQVTDAYRRYVEEGISAHALTKEIWQDAGYSNPGSCETALGQAFHDAGYEVRDRIAATRLASTKHGMAPKHGPRPGYGTYKRRVLRGEADAPRCEGTITTSPKKGQRCTRPAAKGSKFCPGHDPAKKAKREANLARMHEATRRRAAEEALPMDPFARFLRRCIAEEGSQRAAARRLDLNETAISCYARGLGSNKRPKDTIQRRTVERILSQDGRALGELYPDLANEAIAA